MKIRVNRGTLSKRCSKRFGDDGFAVLFPGIYEAEVMGSNEFVFYKKNGEKAYLSTVKIEEKITSGDITFLEVIEKIWDISNENYFINL